MNKLILHFLVLAISGLTAIAQNAPPVDPPELVSAREEHLRAMQRAAIPVLSAYARQLESLKASFTREGKLDAALAVDNELKEVNKEAQAADNAAARTGAALPLTILSAVYGAPAKKHVMDVTKTLRKALESGNEGIKLSTSEAGAGVDPAPMTPKETKIIYTINGQRKEKTFQEGYKLKFKDDLN